MNNRAIAAEFIGTMALIFIGAGAGAIGVGGLVGVALAHGLVVLAFAYSYGHISGTHINPAVTVAMWVGKQIDTATAGSYIVAQLLGGTVGAFLLKLVAGPYLATMAGDPAAANALGQTLLSGGVGPIQGLIVEIILTFFLVNTIFNTAVSGKAGNLAPVAIGLTLVFCILMGGPLTGASLNPARTLGPAIAGGVFTDIWLYFVGPIVGGVLAALLYNHLLKE